MLAKEVLTDRLQWRCQISGRLYTTRQEAEESALTICKQQMRDGIPATTPIRARRKLYELAKTG
jgi:hypothetical protein